MIVETDFLDHWKTVLLINSLETDLAPLYVLRIWSHCQLRKQSRFENLSSEALKALCRFPGQANKLESSLAASGFVRRDESGALIVVNWDEYNAGLLANWENGKRGGRPKKTQSKPTGNPWVTHGKPMANPNETDKSRLDKSRLDKNNKTPNGVSVTSLEVEAIYQAYPIKVGKGRAIKEIAKALKKIPFDDLLRAVKEFAESDAGKAGEFTPHPSTWFHQERWLDDRNSWKSIGRQQRTRDVSGGASVNFDGNASGGEVDF